MKSFFSTRTFFLCEKKQEKFPLIFSLSLSSPSKPWFLVSDKNGEVYVFRTGGVFPPVCHMIPPGSWNDVKPLPGEADWFNPVRVSTCVFFRKKVWGE